MLMKWKMTDSRRSKKEKSGLVVPGGVEPPKRVEASTLTAHILHTVSIINEQHKKNYADFVIAIV